MTDQPLDAVALKQEIVEARNKIMALKIKRLKMMSDANRKVKDSYSEGDLDNACEDIHRAEIELLQATLEMLKP